MKRLYLILLLAAVTFSGMAQTIGDAFYIYRNDGEFNAFFRDEVLSVEYSYEDANGNTFDEIVTQIVNTTDSIYKIPLAAIDSISFVQPKTKYTSNVVRMEPLLPYILSVNGLTLNLSSSMPPNLMPNVGDVLLQDTYASDKFPDGFAGRVIQCFGQQIVCESVSFEDIYEQIVCYGSYIAVNDEKNEHIRFVPRKATGGVSTAISINGTVGSNSSGLWGSINGKLGLEIRSTLKYSIGKSPYFDLSISPDLRIAFEAGVTGSFSTNFLSNKVSLLSIPIPDTPFLLKLKAGPSLKPSVKASVTIATEAALGYKFGVKYEDGGFKGYGQNTSKWFSKPVVSGTISGSIFAGVQTEFGIFMYGDLLSLSIEKEAGAEFVANLTDNLLNSNQYEELQNAQFDLNLKGSVDVVAKAKFLIWETKADWTLLSGKYNWKSWKLVPKFQKPEVLVRNPSEVVVSVKPYENLLFPISIGVGVWDSNGTLHDAQYCPNSYCAYEDWGFSQYQAMFSGITPNQNYTAKPLVKLFGKEIMATPSTEFKTEGEAIPYSVLKNGVLTVYYDGKSAERGGQIFSAKLNGSRLGGASAATKVVFDSSFADYQPFSTEKMFDCCDKLNSIENLRYLNTSEVTNMHKMFSGCSSLKSLDLRSLNTSNVTNMEAMFTGCSSLININLSGFNTSKVKNMSAMFFYCEALTSLNLRSFNTSNVTDMSFMFFYCSSLTTIYAKNWKATNCENVFSACPVVGGQGTHIGNNFYGYDANGNPLYYYCGESGEFAHIDGGKDWPGLFTE